MVQNFFFTFIKTLFMRIALFSDIHANLPALEAFFNNVESHKPDAVYCLGDLVGYNIWPNEVVQQIQSRHIPTLAGNYDYGVGRNSDDCGCAYKTEEEKKNGSLSIAFTNKQITAESRAYLRTLPAHIKVEFQLNNDSLKLLMVHGSPRRINEYLFEERDEKSMVRIMQQADADILCFGHTHKPYHRIFQIQEEENSSKFLHAINLGSVGKPKDGDWRGCYVMIEINENSSVFNKESIQVKHIRFEYDVEKAAQAIEQSELPNIFANMLRQGY
jgi:putative phosphoesterase